MVDTMEKWRWKGLKLGGEQKIWSGIWTANWSGLWAVGNWVWRGEGGRDGGMDGGREAEVDENELESDGVSVEGGKTRETQKRCWIAEARIPDFTCRSEEPGDFDWRCSDSYFDGISDGHSELGRVVGVCGQCWEGRVGKGGKGRAGKWRGVKESKEGIEVCKCVKM
jgi:hypothetical protein